MGFGIKNNEDKISRNTNNSVNTAEKTNGRGDITEMYTYGGAEEVTEEEFSDTFTNEAVNGQVGNTSTQVVTAHNLIESNTDYQRAQKTSRKPIDAATTTTTA